MATVPAVDCGTTLEFYLLAGSLSGLTVSDPPQVPNVLHKGIPNPDLVLFLDDFEDDIGWVVSSMGSGTKGVWTRDEPNGTEFQNLLLQPEYDRSENEGENCYFTGQDDPEDLIGTNDVDLGPVTLTSPIIDMAQHQNVEVRFASWLRSPTGTPDHLLVEISRNAGVQWFNATAIAPTDGWEQIELPLSAFPGLVGSQLRVRFTISDNPSDSLTEAAIDDFEVVSVACDGVLGDANGDGIVNLRDMGILGGCLTGPLTQRLTHCASVDLNNDLRVDLQDISLFERYFRP